MLNRANTPALAHFLDLLSERRGETASFFRSALMAMTLRIVGAALTYLMFMLLARWTAQEEYGYVAFAVSLALFLSVVASVGQPHLVQRFIGEYLGKGRTELVHGVTVRSLRVVIGTSVLAGLGLIALSAVLDSTGAIDRLIYLIIAALLIVPLALAELIACIARALGSITLAVVPRDIVWRIAVPLIAAACMGAGFTLSADLILLIALGSLCTVLFVQLALLWRRMPGTATGTPADPPLGEWRGASRGLWGVAVLGNVTDNLSVVIVGVTLGPAAAAAFFAAMKVAQLIVLPMQGIQLVSPPLISRHYWSGDLAKVKAVCRWSVAAVALPTLAGIAVIVAFGADILGFFGESYRSAHAVLIALAAGAVVQNLSGVCGHLLMMTGNDRLYLKIMLASNVPGLALLAVLAVLYGAEGAAVAYLLTRVAFSVLPVLWARRRLDLDPSIFGVLGLQVKS